MKFNFFEDDAERIIPFFNSSKHDILFVCISLSFIYSLFFSLNIFEVKSRPPVIILLFFNFINDTIFPELQFGIS